MRKKCPEVLMSGHHANIEKWRQRAVCHPYSEESSGSAGKSRAYRQGENPRSADTERNYKKRINFLLLRLGLW